MTEPPIRGMVEVNNPNWPPRRDGWYATGVRVGCEPGSPQTLKVIWSWSPVLFAATQLDRWDRKARIASVTDDTLREALGDD